SDIILCPAVPDRLSFWGLEAFDRYIRRTLRSLPSGSWPRSFYVATRVKRGNFSEDHPQNVYLKAMTALRAPERCVTLLGESGESSKFSAAFASLDEDSQMQQRTAGNPRPRVAWRFEQAYSSRTQSQLKDIARWVIRELGDG